MCGIVAFASWAAPVEPDRIGKSMAALRHRGPDGAGSWTSPDGRVALGHTRLALVDRAGGAQPLSNEAGDVVVVASGEIYGHAPMRHALEQRGHRFRTRSDSEVLVHLWEERGPACFAELRGELAAIVWDARTGTLAAARDRFGVRPLCWTLRDGELWLASEAKALFAAGLEPRWDEDSLWQALRMQYPLPDRTLFRGVRQLEPGHVLLARNGDVSCRPYWELDWPQESTEDSTGRAQQVDDAAARRVREALDDAVRVRVPAEMPVACQLSGGLDSTAVAALAARAGRPLPCFTVAFDDERWNELGLATESARALGLELHAVHADGATLLDALPAAVAQAEGLAINAHLPAKWLLARAMRRLGIGAVLTGEGSDEVFGGYPHLRRDLWLATGDEERLEHLAARNVASAGSMLPAGDALPLRAVQSRLGFVPTWLEAKATLGARVASFLRTDFVAARANDDAFARFLDAIDVPRRLRGRARIHQSAYLWCKTALAGYILRTLGDGMEMAHAIEGRLPFLDHRVFEVARDLAPSQLIRGDTEKWILRRALDGIVPAPVLTRPKHPFLGPSLDLAGNAMVNDLIRSRHLPAAFDQRALVGTLADARSLDAADRIALEPALMLAVTAALLSQEYRL